MRGRLAILMFLQYAAPGAMLPLFSLRLQELQFTPVEIGWACATQALARVEMRAPRAQLLQAA